MGRRGGEVFSHFWRDIKGSIPYLNHWNLGPGDKIHLGKCSAGQRQLISAIRALYLKKKIILFDEISSGLDGDLEEALRRTLRRAQSLGVVFMVAHRPETLLEAQCLLVMDRGEIVARGQASQLRRECALYRKFIEEEK